MSKFYYGDGTDHILDLNPTTVESFLRIEEAIEGYTLEQLVSGVQLDVSEDDLARHSALSDILNAYLETHTVYHADLTVPVLRPVE